MQRALSDWQGALAIERNNGDSCLHTSRPNGMWKHEYIIEIVNYSIEAAEVGMAATEIEGIEEGGRGVT